MDNRIIYPDAALQSQGLDEHLCFYLSKTFTVLGRKQPSQHDTLAYFSLRMALTDLLTADIEKLDPVMRQRRNERYYEYYAVHGGKHEAQYGRMRCHRPESSCVKGPFGIYFTSEFTLEQLKAFTGIPFISSPDQGHPYSLQLAGYTDNFTRLVPTDAHALLQEWATQYYIATEKAGHGMDFELVLKGEQRNHNYDDKTIHQYFTHPVAALQALLAEDIGHFDEQDATDTLRRYTSAYLVNDKKQVSATVEVVPISMADAQTPAGIYLKADDGLNAIAGTRPVDIEAVLGVGAMECLYKMGSYHYGERLSLEANNSPLHLDALLQSGAAAPLPTSVYTLTCSYAYDNSYIRSTAAALDIYHYPRLEQGLYQMIQMDLHMWHCLDYPEPLPLQLLAVEMNGPGGLAAALRMGEREADGSRQLCLVLDRKAGTHLIEPLALLQRNSSPVVFAEPVADAIALPIARRYDNLGLRTYPDIISAMRHVLDRQLGFSVADMVNAHPRQSEEAVAAAELSRRWSVQMHYAEEGPQEGPAAVYHLSSAERAHQFILSLPEEIFRPEDAGSTGRYLQQVNLVDRATDELVCSRYYRHGNEWPGTEGFYLAYNPESRQADALLPDATTATPCQQETDTGARIYRQLPATSQTPNRRILGQDPPGAQHGRRPR